MSGPTLMMAPAMEAITPFHRSHSTPDLLTAVPAVSAMPKPLPSGISTQQQQHSAHSLPKSRANTFKSLPSLPAFDVPSFDLAAEFESSFTYKKKQKTDSLRHSLPKEEVVEIKTETAIPSTVTPVTDAETPSRTRSMIDRPRSWLPSSKSSPDVLSSLGRPPKLVSKYNDIEVPQLVPTQKQRERARTVEAFAEFARRPSWISSSRSPSPPSKAEKLSGANRASTGSRSSSKDKSRDRTGSATSGSRKRSSSYTPNDREPDSRQSTESQGSTRSRALSRATLYFTKIKQRPQSVFSRSASSVSLSSSSVKSSRSSDSDSTAPSASSAATTSDKSTSTTNTQGTAASSTATTTATTKPVNISSKNNASRNNFATSTPRNSSHTSSSLDTTTTASEGSSQATTDTGITMPHPTSRDPLWSTFRTVDVDFAKFVAKTSTAARMSVVRHTLVPFLRSTSHHPSNSNRTILSSEDIDRRATILNKWWNGLLEMLDAGQSRTGIGAFTLATNSGMNSGPTPGMTTRLQPVAGVDRPTLLEALTMIMMRPEWRVCTSYFQPLADRSPEERVRARSGTVSTVDSDNCFNSSTSDFLDQSVEHNVRNMFVSNLLTQMSLVVDKMSMRHAPLSLVNWCGKACAYAFFFAPGIADVLVRLWVLNGDLLRRVADEFGLPRRSKGESEDIVALFPPHLGKLGWTSVQTLGVQLRRPAKLPLLPAKIAWHGPWVTRWRGGDTDLFYIFCKYYYILAEEFMPEGLPLVEKGRAPAFVLVHAQLLSTLDSTIHRQASIEAMMGPPLSDSLHGADASLTGLPIPSNLLKGMDENRLIILLRDMLAENSTGLGTGIKHAFAEAFMAIMKAATKRTSRYENAACFMLCDFLEEALTTFDAFQNSVNNSVATSPIEESAPSSPIYGTNGSFHPIEYIDWSFWFDVGKMIMDSNNTMSEIRILSFLYSVWDAITADAARKEALCLGWLLSEEVFEKFFNNWCPMVRAYYMRLLCWRICRDSGSPNELDSKIFLVVAERLKTVWSHYLWMKESAEANGFVPPSTAPCLPTPGKRFLIIRTEVQPPPPSLLLGFDPLSSSLSGPSATADFNTILANVSKTTGSPKSDSSETSYKKKWSLLGKVLSFSNSQNGAANGSSGGKKTWEEELEQARRETAAMRARPGQQGSQLPAGPPPPPKQNPTLALTPSSDSASSTGSAPIFDASTYVFRFSLTWQGHIMVSRDRILTRPRLPAPAQARVRARAVASNVNGYVDASAPRRCESPPPIAPGLPPATRRVSGLMQTGLVSEARNARPLSVVEAANRNQKTKLAEKRLSLNIDTTSSGLFDDATPSEDGHLGMHSQARFSDSDRSDTERSRSMDLDSEMSRPQQFSIPPVKPVGIYASGAVYTGRALAEWSLVVSECNSFVDRRRDEGVLGLAEVEVPSLGVEGLGMRQRA